MQTSLKLAAALIASAWALSGAAQTASPAPANADAVRIGFITDLSGLYADLDGPAGAEAIRMAVEDFGGKVLGRNIEVLVADHQNKADLAATKAREWIDRDNLMLLIGGTNSSTGLAMNKVIAEKKRVYFSIGAGTSALTNEECTPYTVHYAYDTVALARGTGATVVKQGGKSWFFLTADYAFGYSLEQETTKVVQASGGTVVGSVRHPLGASDFSSFLLQAQSSKAQILGLANAGGDLTNAIKAAKEFGVTPAMKLAALLMFINDVHSLGLTTTEGLLMTDSWYWDRDDASRKFGERFFAKFKRMPSSLQAADYSAAMTYLQAVKAVNSTDADKVMAHIKGEKLGDFYASGYVRGDGQYIHDMYLMQVKAPSESKKPWDYMKILATISGEQAFTSVAESKCALLKK